MRIRNFCLAYENMRTSRNSERIAALWDGNIWERKKLNEIHLEPVGFVRIYCIHHIYTSRRNIFRSIGGRYRRPAISV